MEIFWLHLLTGLVLLASLASLGSSLLIAARQRRGRAETLSSLHSLWRVLRGFSGKLTRLEGRLLELEEGIRQLKQHQEAVDMREPGDRLFRQAIRLAHNGADVDELVASCGSSRGETELLHRVHRDARRDPGARYPGETLARDRSSPYRPY